MAAKSSPVSGLTGLSADASNQASNSGVTSNGLTCSKPFPCDRGSEDAVLDGSYQPKA